MAGAVVDLKQSGAQCEKYLITAANEQSATAAVQQFLDAAPWTGDDVKNVVDVAAKSVLSQFLLNGDISGVRRLIQVLTGLAAVGKCAPITVSNLLTEMFDQSPLKQCHQLFDVVEERIQLWKSELYFEPCKNVLLRTCNDLLRRSSKSLDTIFCGRVQLFLSKLFPLDEKSALNLMGQFNLENVTHFRQDPWDVVEPPSGDVQSENDATVKEEPMCVCSNEKPDTRSLVVDYELYRKFWSLQDIFRNPNSALQYKDRWLNFRATVLFLTNIFETFPLDEHDAVQAKLDRIDAMDAEDVEDEVFFNKYLTNEKLLDLQLSDPTFRRCVITQMLITFQYLLSPAKVKGSLSLTSEQEKIAKELMEGCYKLLRKTPPKGEKFAAAIEKILTNEESWNKWKNEGCVSYVRQHQPLTGAGKTVRRKPPLGDDLAAAVACKRPLKLGSDELDELFSTTNSSSSVVDNLPQCRLPTAQPALKDFFNKAMTQLDAECKIPEEQKLIRKSEWQWRALRLLTTNGPHFFSSGNERAPVPPKKLAMNIPEFLDIQLRLLAHSMGIKINTAKPTAPAKTGQQNATPTKLEKGDKPMTNEDENSKGGGNQADIETTDQDPQENLVEEAATPGANSDAGGATGGADSASGPLVRDYKQSIALLISAHWQSLAKSLKFEEDEIAYFESQDADDKSLQAQRMIELWEERESNYGADGPVPLSKFETELRKVTGLESIADRLNKLPNVNN